MMNEGQLSCHRSPRWAVQMQNRRQGERSASHVLLLGPLGAGPSMLARQLTTILPAMTLAEALEATRIHRVAGLPGATSHWRGCTLSRIARQSIRASTGNDDHPMANCSDRLRRVVPLASRIALQRRQYRTGPFQAKGVLPANPSINMTSYLWSPPISIRSGLGHRR
jgi:hypothetical protein